MSSHGIIHLTRDADWSQIHEPNPDNPVEAPFYAANDRGRVAALDLLGLILPGLPLARLAQTTDSAVFHKTSAVAALRDLFDPEPLIDDLLWSRGLHGRQLALAREGSYLGEDLILAPVGPAGRPRVQVSQLAALLDRGFTAIFNGIDVRDGTSMRLSEAFERVFGCEVNINGYLSMRPQMSFGAHWDPQETVILQLLGRKCWLLEEPLALSMNRNVHGEATSERPVWEGLLEPGAALYIPRGWGHRVRSTEGLTFHFTVTVPRTNGMGVLARSLDRTVRTPSPLVSLPSVAGDRDASRYLPSISDSEVNSSLASYRLEIASRSTQRITEVRAALADDVENMWVRFTSAGGWVVQGTVDRRVVVGCSGRQFSIDERYASEVARYADGLARPWPIPESPEAETVRELVRLGVLDVMRGPLPWGHPVAVDGA